MQKRLPEIRAIVQVYAVIAVLLSAWTLIAFLWRLSAWLLLLNLGEILTIFSYAMLTNFLESLTVLFALLGASVILPARILREDFAVRGTILALGLISSLNAFVSFQMRVGFQSGLWLLVPPLMVLLLTAFLLAVSSRSRLVRSTALWVSDRLVVFLFILLPLFVLFSFYVLYRNIA
jgi:hypothetical protein